MTAMVDAVLLFCATQTAMAFPRRIEPESLGPVALGQIEAHGLERFSLRGVARALGVTPNALYRHVGSREGLLVEAAA